MMMDNDEAPSSENPDNGDDTISDNLKKRMKGLIPVYMDLYVSHKK